MENGEKQLVLYVHGMGGAAAESEHYRPLFPKCTVEGLDYRSDTPWEAGQELRAAAEARRQDYAGITLIANSIGAFYAMHAGLDALVRKAYFISPIVDMEQLICDLMRRAGVTEAELRSRGTVRTAFGDELSWNYLSYVRSNPLRWSAPTEILWGSRDELTDRGTILAFPRQCGAGLTVMENGEHWFHTAEQMRFLDGWITGGRCR